MESKIARFFGDERLNKVHIQNLSTGAVTEMPIGGVFIFIGYVPNTEKLSGIVELNANKKLL
jgi:thioredoxin reductase (NADPH)